MLQAAYRPWGGTCHSAAPGFNKHPAWPACREVLQFTHRQHTSGATLVDLLGRVADNCTVSQLGAGGLEDGNGHVLGHLKGHLRILLQL